MQMALFAEIASGPYPMRESNIGMNSSAGQSVRSKSSKKKANRVSLTLVTTLQKIEDENWVNDDHESFFVSPGEETRNDPEMCRIARGVIGRALLDIFEQQTSAYHRRSAMRFIFSDEPDHVQLRNLWCSWAGVHPERLIQKVKERVTLSTRTQTR